MNVQAFANKINVIGHNDYVQKLARKPSIISFVKSQSGFQSAIHAWSDCLLLLCKRCESRIDRRLLINNLYDEHGNGNPNDDHVETFNNMMRKLTGTQTVVCTGTEANTPVMHFINDLTKEINDRPENSVAYIAGMLGMIEYTYIDVSNAIYKYLNKVCPEATTHYDLHSTVDVQHANDLFSIGLRNYDDSMKAGMCRGFDIMNRFYQDISRSLKMDTSE